MYMQILVSYDVPFIFLNRLWLQLNMRYFLRSQLISVMICSEKRLWYLDFVGADIARRNVVCLKFCIGTSENTRLQLCGSVGINLADTYVAWAHQIASVGGMDRIVVSAEHFSDDR